MLLYSDTFTYLCRTIEKIIKLNTRLLHGGDAASTGHATGGLLL